MLTILLGESDNNSQQGVLRQTRQAMNQGKHRLERSKNFFNQARIKTEQTNVVFNWQLVIVPKVGHECLIMSQASVNLL